MKAGTTRISCVFEDGFKDSTSRAASLVAEGCAVLYHERCGSDSAESGREQSSCEISNIEDQTELSPFGRVGQFENELCLWRGCWIAEFSCQLL